MFPLHLRVPPARTDRYGRPWYPVEQDRGLVEQQGDELMRAGAAGGYLAQVDEIISRRVAHVVSRLAGDRPLDILELGGGTGHFFDRLRRFTRTYVNIEPGDVELDGAGRRRLDEPAYTSIRCSAESVPVDDECADLVMALASLDHMPHPDIAVREARRCLRPGGYLLVSLNNRASWWKSALRGTRYLAEREALIAREHSVLWSVADCERHVAPVGRVVGAQTVVFVPYVPLVWPLVLPVANFIGDRLKSRGGAHSIVVGRRL